MKEEEGTEGCSSIQAQGSVRELWAAPLAGPGIKRLRLMYLVADS